MWKTFAKLVRQGKINAALLFLSDESYGGVLPLSEEVLQSLRDKHPSPAEIKPNSLLYGPIAELHNVSIAIDEQDILATAKGAAGPSGLDANQYIRMLCLKQFYREGKEQHEQIALFLKKIATKSIIQHHPRCEIW